jgi:molybdopterin-guanine dinucleotide biosynthesis protein A
MKRAGFVLVGGASTRMGRDKALLPYRGATLVRHVAALVEAAAGSVTLVGSRDGHAGLGYPLIPDNFPGCGPLAGLQAALAASPAEWNLVVACDMPVLTVDLLARLLEAAAASGADALVPVSPGGRPEPLCAVYRRELARPLALALARGVRKVSEALAGLRVALWPVSDPERFENLNTPEDWARYGSTTAEAPHQPLLGTGAP